MHLQVPCEILPGFTKSANIEFDESAPVDTLLFTLPFAGGIEQMDIKFKSNELNDTAVNKYFKLDSKSFRLKSHYDLDTIQIDLIELVFICSAHSMTNTFLLYITINDVNNNAPSFVSQPYNFTLNEVEILRKLNSFLMKSNLNVLLIKLTPVGTIVFRDLKAIDNDLPNKPNSQTSFSIVNGTCAVHTLFDLIRF